MTRLSIMMTLALCPALAAAQSSDDARAAGAQEASAGTGAAAAAPEQAQSDAKQPTAQGQDAASAASERAPIQHLPINELESGPASMRFALPEPDRTGALIVRFQGGEAAAARTAAGYVAQLPEALVQPPGFAYWVVERMQDGSELPVFASAASPHRVRVFHSDARRAELERLRERGGTRSSLIAAAEYVDFGERQLQSGGGTVPDRYYRLETGYAYAFLSTVEEIELRVVRVRGEAADLRAVRIGGMPELMVERVDPGIDYGRAAITLLLADGIRLQGSMLLGASQEGFEYGTGGALIFGNPRGIHVTLSGETLSTLGFTTGMRMGFLAAERLPMGAGVEISNFPVGEDTGVRLIYDVGYELAPATALMLRAGFQGRTSVTGGPTAGLLFRYGF